MTRAVLRIATCRLRWALSVWKEVTEEAIEEREVAAAQAAQEARWEAGCVRKMQVGLCVGGWGGGARGREWGAGVEDIHTWVVGVVVVAHAQMVKC